MRLSIRFKLAILALVPLFFYTGTSFLMLSDQRQIFEEVSDQVHNTSNAIQELVLNADRDMYQANVAYLKIESGSFSGADLEVENGALAENLAQVEDRMTQAMSIIAEHDLGELQYGASGKSVHQLMEEYKKNFSSWKQAVEQAAADNVNLTANAAIDSGFANSRAGIDEIDENMNEHVKLTMEQIDQELIQAERVVIFLVALVTIGILTAVFIQIRQIMKTIRAVVTKTQMVAGGDLTAAPEKKYSKDELGLIAMSLDSMIVSVKELVTRIAENAAYVGKSSVMLSASAKESSDASSHVAQDIQEVTESTELQARAAKETAKAVEEMTIGIQRIADNTSQIADQSNTTSQQTEQGQTTMNQFTMQMEEISSVMGRLGAIIEALGKRSEQIAGIADNITSFSNQTNILSLNASIEAARAGDAGKGFAVVATEIRKLASSSLSSAEDIHQLVSGTRKDIEDAALRMQETLQEMSVGRERVQEVDRNFNLIASSISSMTSQLQENSAITEQMSASSEQVSASMDETAASAEANLGKAESVAASTEEQLALMDTIASSAQQLDEIVRELDAAVTRFKV